MGHIRLGVSYQKIVNTEPSKIAIYNGQEIQTLVPVEDPTNAEIEISYEARPVNAAGATAQYGPAVGARRQAGAP